MGLLIKRITLKVGLVEFGFARKKKQFKVISTTSQDDDVVF